MSHSKRHLSELISNSISDRSISRRKFIQFSGVAVTVTIAGSLLAACEADDDEPAAGTADDTEDVTDTDDVDDDEPEDPDDVGAEDVDDGVAEETPDDDRYGGTFTAATPTPPPTLDVMTSSTAAAREATWMCLETLLTYDEEYELMPLLAEDWESNEEGDHYSFALKQGVLFHNGDEMTVEDVVASIDRFLEVTNRQSEFAVIDSYEASDEYTLELQLTAPSVAILTAIAIPYNSLKIYPAEVIEGKEPGDINVEDTIGTGPYQLVEWVPDQHLNYEAFRDYHNQEDERTGLGGGKIPYFDEVRLVSVPETGSRVAGIETGEYHFAADPPPTDYERLEEDPNLTPYIVEDSWWVVLLLNHRNELVQDINFRRALQAAADMEPIAMAIADGNPDFFQLQGSIYFPVSPYYTEVATELYNQANLELAEELLSESDYDGQEIVMVTNRNYDYMYSAVVAFEEQIRTNLGINSTVDVVDWPAQQARWEESDWHVSTTGYATSQAGFAPDAYAGFYGGDGSGPGAGYDNPEMIEAFEAAAASVDMDERIVAFEQVQRIWHEDVAGLKICDRFPLTAVSANVQGFEPWYNMTRFWSCWFED